MYKEHSVQKQSPTEEGLVTLLKRHVNRRNTEGQQFAKSGVCSGTQSVTRATMLLHAVSASRRAQREWQMFSSHAQRSLQGEESANQ